MARYSCGMTAMRAELTLSQRIAAEVRAEMARRGLSARKFALQLGVSNMWVNRRVGMHADQELTLEDLERISASLGITWQKLLRDADLLPRLDSNQQPSGYRTTSRKRSARRRPDAVGGTGAVIEIQGAAA